MKTLKSPVLTDFAKTVGAIVNIVTSPTCSTDFVVAELLFAFFASGAGNSECEVN